MENQDDNDILSDILSPEERKNKLNEKEKRKVKKSIECKRSSVLTFEGKKI